MARNRSSKSFGVADDLEFEVYAPPERSVEQKNQGVPAQDTDAATPRVPAGEGKEGDSNVQNITTEHEKKITGRLQPGNLTYGTTQGNREGIKMRRMNLALSDVNYSFIVMNARISGKTYSGYINGLLDAEREKLENR